MAQSLHSITQGGVDANYEIPLDMSMYIFSCNKTGEAIILKWLSGHPEITVFLP